MISPRIAITCGDPAGVGPELVRKCFSSRKKHDAEFTLIGPQKWIDEVRSESQIRIGSLAVGLASSHYVPGEPTHEGSKIALEAMERAARGCSVGNLTEW